MWCGVGLFHRAPASAFSSSDPAPCSLSRSPSLFLSAPSIFHHPTAVSTRARTITAPLRPPSPISHYMICFACSVSTRFYSFIPRITLSGPFAFVPSPFSIHHHSLTPSQLSRAVHCRYRWSLPGFSVSTIRAYRCRPRRRSLPTLASYIPSHHVLPCCHRPPRQCAYFQLYPLPPSFHR